MSRSHRGSRGNGVRRAQAPATSFIERQPPFDMDAEQSLIGSIMLMPSTLDNVAGVVNENDFYIEANKILFRTMADMYSEQVGIDATTMVSRLRADENYELVGGSQYVAELFTKVPNAAHGVYYASTVKELSIRRGVLEAAIETMRMAHDDRSLTSHQLITQIQTRYMDIADSIDGGISVNTIGDLIPDHLEHLDQLRNGNIEAGLSTGLLDFDNYLRFRESEVNVLGARPSQGKSALGLNIAENVAINQGQPTVFVSMEMGTTELLNRHFASRANVNLVRFQHGSFSNDEMDRIRQQACDSREAMLTFVDSTGLNMSQIASIARQAKRTGRCELLVLDYIQLILPDRTRDTREQQVSKISRAIKRLARELAIPILVLAQVNRGPGDMSRAPKLSELRESGAIEQDADNVFFIHRPEYYLSLIHI